MRFECLLSEEAPKKTGPPPEHAEPDSEPQQLQLLKRFPSPASPFSRADPASFLFYPFGTTCNFNRRSAFRQPPPCLPALSRSVSYFIHSELIATSIAEALSVNRGAQMLLFSGHPNRVGHPTETGQNPNKTCGRSSKSTKAPQDSQVHPKTAQDSLKMAEMNPRWPKKARR
jgi:hypothetical protein